MFVWAALSASAFGQGAAVEEIDRHDLQELEHAKQQMADQVNSLNQLNPLSNDNALTPGGQVRLDPSKLPPQLQFLAPVLANEHVMKRTQAIATLSQDPKFKKSAEAIVANENLKWMYVGFVVVFVLYLLIKSRVLAATDRFLVRLILRLALVPVFFGGIFLVAYGVLGQPVVDVLTLFYKGMV